ncbi:unnamed protein product, partial [Aphanomyces euteiches]
LDHENKLYMEGINVPKIGKGVGSFINREERGNSLTRKNCEFEYTPGGARKLWTVVTKKIKQGQELFTTYSRGIRFTR